MNNKKILIATIALVVLIAILGIYILIGNGNKNTNSIQQTQPTSNQSTSNESATKPAAKENGSIVGAANIILTNAEFMPKDVTIKAGSTVMWINKSGATADIKSDSHPTHLLYPFLNLGQFASGTTLQVVFEKVGKYSYHNELNLSEIGTVTVE